MPTKDEIQSDIPISHNNHLYSIGQSFVNFAKSYTPPKATTIRKDSGKRPAPKVPLSTTHFKK